MSNAPAPSPAIPAWDVADRMRKALRHGDVSVNDMAAYLDVHRNTVSSWLNGRIEPSVRTVRLFALRCGVPYEWLSEGIEPTHPTPGPEGLISGELSSACTSSALAEVVPLRRLAA